MMRRVPVSTQLVLVVLRAWAHTVEIYWRVVVILS